MLADQGAGLVMTVPIQYSKTIQQQVAGVEVDEHMVKVGEQGDRVGEGLVISMVEPGGLVWLDKGMMEGTEVPRGRRVVVVVVVVKGQ